MCLQTVPKEILAIKEKRGNEGATDCMTHLFNLAFWILTPSSGEFL